ncbi:MAG: hypothetical protein JXB88_01690 [Spirochaetales bacterium]|nr:hypothetical protein [Spirochaetales bacterium]
MVLFQDFRPVTLALAGIFLDIDVITGIDYFLLLLIWVTILPVNPANQRCVVLQVVYAISYRFLGSNSRVHML